MAWPRHNGAHADYNRMRSLLVPLVDIGVLDISFGVRVTLLSEAWRPHHRCDASLEHELRDVAVRGAVDREVREQLSCSSRPNYV